MTRRRRSGTARAELHDWKRLDAERKAELDYILGTMLDSNKNVSDLNITVEKPLQVESSGEFPTLVCYAASLNRTSPPFASIDDVTIRRISARKITAGEVITASGNGAAVS